VLLQHRDVDRLAQLDSQPFTHLVALPDDVEPVGDRAGQRDQPDPEPVLAPIADLLDQAPPLERGEQPEGGRLVHGDIRGHLADPGLPAAGQHLQNVDGLVNGVHDTVPTRGVAHRETVSLNSNSSLDVAVPPRTISPCPASS
jgi:hypothetical protein